jgi:3-hydroxyacyl-[acyl-carrier-protein] dehydratase
VLNSSIISAGFIATIQLDADHIVYTGHFPGHPVTPGVVQMQIVHELLEHYLHEDLKLVTMPECKFLKILNPKETAQIVVHLEFERTGELVNVKASAKNEDVFFFRLNAIYRSLNLTVTTTNG